jgi:hypothetical protein
MNKKKYIVKDQEEDLVIFRDEQKQELLLRMKKNRVVAIAAIGDEQEK